MSPVVTPKPDTERLRRQRAMATHPNAQPLERERTVNPFYDPGKYGTPLQDPVYWMQSGTPNTNDYVKMQYLANSRDPSFNIERVAGNQQYYNFNQSLQNAGKLDGDAGYSYTLTPEYQQVLSTMGNVYSPLDVSGAGVNGAISHVVNNGVNGVVDATKDAVRQQKINAVTDSWEKMLKDQSIVEKFGGYKNFFTKAQESNDRVYQYGMYLKQKGDPRGDMYINHARATQYALNAALPKVRQKWNDTVDGYKNKATNFAKNNWWWMVPGGMLLGARLFGGNGQQQGAPQQPAPYDPLHATPEGWDQSTGKGAILQ